MSPVAFHKDVYEGAIRKVPAAHFIIEGRVITNDAIFQGNTTGFNTPANISTVIVFYNNIIQYYKFFWSISRVRTCLLYTSDAADE